MAVSMILNMWHSSWYCIRHSWLTKFGASCLNQLVRGRVRVRRLSCLLGSARVRTRSISVHAEGEIRDLQQYALFRKTLPASLLRWRWCGPGAYQLRHPYFSYMSYVYGKQRVTATVLVSKITLILLILQPQQPFLPYTKYIGTKLSNISWYLAQCSYYRRFRTEHTQKHGTLFRK